jgi:hypothetical protein
MEYCGFLTKLDRDGNTQWCKRFGDPFVEQGSAVAFDRNGGDILAAGFIRNKLPLETSNKVQSVCMFARYGPSGILQWSKTFGARAFPNTLSVIPGGEILLTGHFEQTVDFGLGTLESAGGNDIFAAIFTSNGSPLWSKRFGDAREQFLVRGVHDACGLVALAGSFHGTIDFGKGALVASGYDGISEGTEDVFLALFEAQQPRKDQEAQLEENNREFIRVQKQKQSDQKISGEKTTQSTDPKVGAILSYVGKVVSYRISRVDGNRLNC